MQGRKVNSLLCSNCYTQFEKMTPLPNIPRDLKPFAIQGHEPSTNCEGYLNMTHEFNIVLHQGSSRHF